MVALSTPTLPDARLAEVPEVGLQSLPLAFARREHVLGVGKQGARRSLALASSLAPPPPPSPPSQSPAPRVAVLVTGKMRFASDDDAARFNANYAHCDVFLVTYDADASAWAAALRHVALITVVEDAVPRTIEPTVANQWWLLQLALASPPWRQRLLAYDVLARARTDLTLLEPLRLRSRPAEGVVHAASDNFFYAAAPTFVAAFARVHNDFVARGYYRADAEQRVPLVPVWANLAASAFDDASTHACPTRWYWLAYPRCVLGYPRVSCAADMRRILRLRLADVEAATAALRRRGPLRPDDFGLLCDPSFGRVVGFCSESAFLHHCLEHGPVRPCECAASVFLPVRAQRRPVWDKAGDDLEAAFAEIAEGAATCSS